MPKQDAVFSSGEGDQWFQRNQVALNRANAGETDPVLRVIGWTGLKPVKVIEIGASNGFRLNLLRQRYGCDVTAVEPSARAIEQGRSAFPEVRFFQGVASAIPVAEDGAFDLVIVNAVLHWVDRSTLLRSCAELDRLVADGGFLVIGDFFPPSPERVQYHHRSDVELYTYKQNYPEIFLATRLYTQFASVVVDHEGWVNHPDIAPRDRFQISVLKKTGTEGHLTREFKKA